MLLRNLTKPSQILGVRSTQPALIFCQFPSFQGEYPDAGLQLHGDHLPRDRARPGVLPRAGAAGPGPVRLHQHGQRQLLVPEQLRQGPRRRRRSTGQVPQIRLRVRLKLPSPRDFVTAGHQFRVV